MESALKIKYIIYDMFDNHFETEWHTEAEASLEEGKFVYEVHETTWRTPHASGQNIVQYEWQQQ
jgi:hypothetical protein